MTPPIQLGISVGITSLQVLDNKSNGGESGIRTHVTLSSKHAFQACAFSHSAISPRDRTVSLTKRAVGSYWRYLRQPSNHFDFMARRLEPQLSTQQPAISQFLRSTT